jgi:hypothetical protein
MAKRQAPTLTATFKMAHHMCPERKSSSVSREKVEKVLKPPQKPTKRKRTGQESFENPLEANHPTPSARIALASKLEHKVAIGKLTFHVEAQRLIPNRHKLPSPPPIKTANHAFMKFRF